MIDISKLSSRYDVQRLDDSDADLILRLCGNNTLYYQYCDAEPSREQVLRDLHITPPGVDMSRKYYVGFFREEELAAVMDLIDGYPEPEIGYIGFFMVSADLQGKEIGSGIIRDVCAYLKQTGKTAVRLAMARDNPQATHFWKKNGLLVIREAEQNGWTALVAEKKL